MSSLLQISCNSLLSSLSRPFASTFLPFPHLFSSTFTFLYFPPFFLHLPPLPSHSRCGFTHGPASSCGPSWTGLWPQKRNRKPCSTRSYTIVRGETLVGEKQKRRPEYMGGEIETTSQLERGERLSPTKFLPEIIQM